MNTITMCGIASNVSLVMPIRTIVTNAMPFTKNIKNGIIFITPILQFDHCPNGYLLREKDRMKHPQHLGMCHNSNV